MSTASVPMNAGSTGGGKKNAQDQQDSPTSVMALSIDVNIPHDQQSVSDSKSKAGTGRRRRKGKARGNQVEPVFSPSPRYGKHGNNKKKNSNSNGYSNNEGAKRSSSFRTPIVSWRGSRAPRSSNNNRYNNNSNSSGNNRQGNKNWNNTSPHFNNLSSRVCPASTGYPTSKKQHDAPMKKRDLYFSLHVERVGIVSNPANNEMEGSELQQNQKAVARVTLTNWDNEFVLDTFVAIPVPVFDFYDTGIRPENVDAKAVPDESREESPAPEMMDGNASSFAAIRSKVEQILRGKILIGYELEEGLQALGLNHPNTDMRDCSVYFSQNGASNATPQDNDEPSPPVSLLENLSQKELKRCFQSAKAKIAKDSPNRNDVMILSKNSSVSRKPVQICVTTMDLYKKHRKEWETTLIAQARERDRHEQGYLLKISQQRLQEQQKAQRQAQAQQQYREMTASLHCEMVRTALSGLTKTLARVTIVDGLSRNVLLDEFAQIPVPVTDFCDTGINDRDVTVGNESHANDPAPSNAMPLVVLRGHVERIFHRRILVGYKVQECLIALGLTLPWMQVRDIAFFPPFLRTKVVGGSTSVVTVRSLDELSEEFLRQRLRPVGDRSRPLDLCHCAMGLYETFRGQWEQQSHSQQQGVFAHQHNQQQQLHNPHHIQGQMLPPSPSTIMQSPHLRPNHYFGQQPPTPTYNAPMMMTPPSQQQPQRQPFITEQQQYPDIQSRTSSNSSSWLPWGKQQTQIQNNAVGASQTLSTQALQVLQEDFSEFGSSSPKNHFLPVSSHSGTSAFAERTSSYDGSVFGEGSEFSGVTSELFTESVVSSLRDESSSVISGDQASTIPAEQKGESSSWFRFVSKKSKDQARSDTNTNCETMTAVQETEVLTDGGMLPLPVQLFPPLQGSSVDTTNLKTENTGGKEDEARSDSSSNPPLVPRSWFGFRKSPVPRERSRSPSSSFLHSSIEDLSIAAQPEGLADTATEASIEITLSIPASVESDETISSLIEKPVLTSLASRPSSSSFFGRLRSLKPSGSKSSNNCVNSLGKYSAQSKILGQPDLKPAPTERTTEMDDDWLQEIMSQSTGGTTQDLEPWMNGTGQAKSVETSEKQLSASQGQASWFAFKRSKGTATKENAKAEDVNQVGTWSDGASTGGYWLPEEANALTPSNIGDNNNDIHDIFHTRARLPTESTIPSVATDELEEEHSESESYSNDLDFGAAQSFNFLKI